MEQTTRPPLEQHFDLTKGRDELNLAEFPLFDLAARTPRSEKTLRFSRKAWNRSQKCFVERELTITGSDAYGLPQVRDGDVLFALLLVGKQTGAFDAEGDEIKIRCSIYQLLKILGWDGGGRDYRRVVEAFDRWSGVTFRYKNAWYDNGKKLYEDGAFQLVSEYKTRRGGKPGRRPRDQLNLFGKASGPSEHDSVIVLSSRLSSSIRNNYIRTFNFDTYRQLTSAIAKQMFRFLGKRFFHAPHLEFDLVEFATQHVGMSGKYKPADMIRKMEKATRELEACGFIVPVDYKKRFERVARGKYLVRFSEPADTEVVRNETGQDATADQAAVIESLKQRGVTAATAAKIALSPAIPLQLIRDKIELMDWLLEEQPDLVRNPGGFLVKAIRDDFALPPGFLTKSQRQQMKADRAAAAQKKDEAHRRQLEQEERERQEAEAAYHASCDRLEAYVDSLESEVRQSLLEAAQSETTAPFHLKGRAAFEARCRESERLHYHAFVVALKECLPEDWEERFSAGSAA